MDIKIFDFDFLNELSLSTREYATLTWTVIFFTWLVYTLWRKKDLKPIRSLIKIIVTFKVMVPTLLYSLWFALGIYVLFKLGLWNPDYLKVSIYWFLSEGLIVFFSIDINNKNSSFRLKIKRFIYKSLSISALITILVNTYTFNYFVELAIVIISFIIMLIIIFTKKFSEDNQTSSSCIEIIVGVVLIHFLAFITIYNIYNFETSDYEELLIEYLLLIIFTIWVIPAVYSIRIYAVYELIWFRIRFLKYIHKKKSLKIAVFRNCHINLYKLEKFYNDKKWKTKRFESEDEIKIYFSEFNKSLS